jgi:ribosomal protein L37AE/L43A
MLLNRQSICNQSCATTVYGTVHSYTVRYGNTVYSRIYTVLDRIYGKIRYGVRYGPNLKILSQKIKIELCFSSANGQMAK